MTSTQIRQSFLDFFKSKQHTIVPSSSLMPDSPNLLFTNAGMNQFVPIFLGQTKCPYTPGRAADTQKCIRAGGKHNDLDDVGLDTYHHTFFEMLGNWSFGDYFKKEAIDRAWELVVGIWKFPPQRLYATIYNPDKTKGDPSDRDEEAWSFWAEKFRAAGLDPAIHIVNGNKKDNFWMMGDTGPCGPCSELHVDLTPLGDTRGSLVNQGDARCIEIWNLVFIQFNANPDGTFTPLPAQHVDTGMGFERVTSIIQGTRGFTDFAHAKISNYETDIFRPIFAALEKMSGKKYTNTLPQFAGSATVPVASVGVPPSDSSREVAPSSSASLTSHAPGAVARDAQQSDRDGRAPQDQIAIDIAFRVIADHIRTLSFAIADGIQPGNNDRNYVLRRILRRAVRYGRTLGFHEPFFYKLVDVLAETMGDVFPEIRAKKKNVQETIQREEEAFNKTLDKGLEIFEDVVRLENDLQQTAKELKLPVATMLNDEEIIDFNKRYVANKWFEVPETVRKKTIAAFGERMLGCSRQLDSSLRKLNASLWTQIARPSEKILMRADGFRAAAEQFESVAFAEDWYDNVGEEYFPNWQEISQSLAEIESHTNQVRGGAAFLLYDTYGFPLDLTELMARERGLTVDKEGFEKLMEEQRTRARAAQKKEVISLSQIETTTPTKFVGYENLAVQAKVLEVVSLKDKTAVILDTSACYAEMGGQVGDTGELTGSGNLWRVTNTQKSGNTWLHLIEEMGSATVPVASVGVPPTESPRGVESTLTAPSTSSATGAAARDAQQSDRDGRAPQPRALQIETTTLPILGSVVTLSVDALRRNAIQRHHTVTHLLHWALHEVVSKEASQKGSFVGPDKLTFDFNSAALTPAQVADIEKLVNERILENAGVSWTEVAHADVKNRKDVMQFFGDKYGDTVRVVQIGGGTGKLDGYSMELCGGTHTRATGEIGLFRIVSEAAVAAGVRRIEAVAGLSAYDLANQQLHLIKNIAGKINSPVGELEKKIESLLEQQKELEKKLKSAIQRNAAQTAAWLLTRAQDVNGIPLITQYFPDSDGDYLQVIVDEVKRRFKGVIVVGGVANDSVTLIANVSPDFTAKVQAGKIIQTIAPIVGGKGGGKPDNARGGGKDVGKLEEALAKVKTLIS